MTALPIPDKDAIQHSHALIDHIVKEMEGKSLSFSDFMQLCLYAPGLGYYVAGSEKFGEEGDFITAPMISPLFAATLAQFMAERIHGPIQILELGAGNGLLARGLLEAFAITGRECTYYILELSPDCQAKQRDTLSDYLGQVSWLDQLPKHFKGIILANEVLDAMPVHVFRYQGGDLYERRVVWDAHQFTWQDETIDNPLLARMIEALPLSETDKQDYSSELNMILPMFIRSLVEVLDKGTLVFIDYGFLREQYYHPDRSMGTLMCHYRHLAHSDPFLYPGLQDITAHVDFSVVGETAQAAGCEVSLYSQAEFLIHHGLLEIMEAQLQGEDDRAALVLSQQVQKLLQPHEMGELFKVMVINKP
jgi:SAM-dependent MidA family methyltransferase